MNSAVISVQITQAPQLRYTSDNQTPITEAIAKALPLKEGDADIVFKVVAWGNAATEFSEIQEGRSLILIGRWGMSTIERPEGFKEKRAEFTVSRWEDAPLIPLNQISLVGRVGGDVDTKYFESGTVTSSFTLAVNRPKRDSDPDWFSIETWGKTAEVASNHVRKGGLTGITGSLKLETWQDRNSGAQRSKPIIRVDRLDLLGSKSDRQEAPGNYDDYSYAPATAPRSPQPTPQRQRAAAAAVEPDYEDIPFLQSIDSRAIDSNLIDPTIYRPSVGFEFRKV